LGAQTVGILILTEMRQAASKGPVFMGRLLGEAEIREREREKKVGGVVRDTTVLEGGVIET
jgi:hypothetical protein